MNHDGITHQAESEISMEQAAWKVGHDRFLAIQTCEDGYDFTLYDENLVEIDGGQLDAPEKSMNEICKEILVDFQLDKQDLVETDYDALTNRAIELEIKSVHEHIANKHDPISDLAAKLERFGEDFDPYEYRDQVDDPEALIDTIKSDLTKGNTESYRKFLIDVIEEDDDEALVKAAKELIGELDNISTQKVSVIEKLSHSSEKSLSTKIPRKHAEPEL